jgi:oligopeptide/dipeptide ABC transporter ATP-binding protein
VTLWAVLTSFKGRINRLDYWIKGAIPLGFVVLAPVVVLTIFGHDDAALVVFGALALAALWPMLAVTVKRLHDRDHPGWHLALQLFPVLGQVFAIWLVVDVGFLKGTYGRNRFGDDPSGAFADVVLEVSPDALITVGGLTKYFALTRGVLVSHELGQVHAVDDVSLEVKRGETLGLVGETGCGKSTLARVVTRLIEPTSGRIVFDGKDITAWSRRQLRPLRRDMQIILQDPYSALNPRRPVGAIIGEPLRIHKLGSKKERRARVREVMEFVGLNPEHYNRFPYEFSGGQRQRIGVARAIVTKPKLILADEPVSALDVSIQAQVLNLLEDLRDEMGLTLLFIAHDLSVVRHVSDRIAVMYLGKIVELAPPETLCSHPKHPYSGALLSAVPVATADAEEARSRRIILHGDPPSPVEPPSGCRFHTRCPKAQPLCSEVEPPLAAKGLPEQFAACHFPLTEEEIERAILRPRES